MPTAALPRSPAPRPDAVPAAAPLAPSATVAGSVCAGLRWTLLSGWRDGFPITRSPYQEIARHAGGTLRELLGHGRALVADGSLDGVAPCWGAAMHGAIWRVAAGTADVDEADVLAAAVADLPGVVSIDRPETVPAGAPALWFTLIARHDEAARTQLARLPDGTVRRVAAARPADTPGCPAGADPDTCPCRDPSLAAGLEARLPVMAHPYEALAARVGRHERDVLARLRSWQRGGRLRDLGLQPPPVARRIPCRLLGATGITPDDAAWTAVVGMPGVVDGWRWDGGWQLVVTAVPDGPAAPLARALRLLGPAARGAIAQAACRCVVRDAPLLFGDEDGRSADDPRTGERTGAGPMRRRTSRAAETAAGLRALQRQLGW